MEIKINKKKFNIKYTLRALFIFEQISGKMFELKTLMDEYVFFYCLLLANNTDMDLTFENFIDELDKDPSIMFKYQDFMTKEVAKQNQYKVEKTVDDKKKS